MPVWIAVNRVAKLLDQLIDLGILSLLSSRSLGLCVGWCLSGRL